MESEIGDWMTASEKQSKAEASFWSRRSEEASLGCDRGEEVEKGAGFSTEMWSGAEN